MYLDQMFKAGLDCGGVTGFAVGKADIVFQCDLPCRFIDELIALRQPGFQSAVICYLHQRLTDAIADAGPAGVCVVGVDVGLFVFCVKSRVAKYKGFLCIGGVRGAGGSCGGVGAAAAAGKNANRETERQ